MNDRTKKLLESVGSKQSQRRRRDRSKQDAVDSVLESTRGARPSDESGSLDGVDIQAEPEGNEFAPVAANLGIGDGDMPAEEPGVPGEAPVELTPESVAAAAEQIGMKPIEMEGLDMDAVRSGAEHEQEHFEDINMAAAVAAHHIAKHPTYYEALDKMEAELAAPEGDEMPTPSDEAKPDDDDYTEVSPDSMGGVDAEGDEDEEGKFGN